MDWSLSVPNRLRCFSQVDSWCRTALLRERRQQKPRYDWPLRVDCEPLPQERYLRFSIMNLAKPRLKLFETTQKLRQYLRLVRYFWQGFEELNHIPQLFRFNPDLMYLRGLTMKTSQI
jgi:hypothetical protein